MQTSFKYIVATLAAPALLAGAALAIIREPDTRAAAGAPSPAIATAPAIAPLPGTTVVVRAPAEHSAATEVAVSNPPPATATPVPEAPTPAPENAVPSEMPRVLSMRSDHAGPGAVIVRFSTNVPATGEIRVMTEQDGEDFFFSVALDNLATEHEISVPANFGRYVVLVEDEFGNEARGTLRYAIDPDGIDFDNGEFAPTLEALTAKKLFVRWGFASDHPNFDDHPGRVLVYATDAGCITIDGCSGELTGPAIEPGTESTGSGANSTVLAAIPGSAFDYQVVIARSAGENESESAFIQLEIDGHELPKTNFSGPSSLSQ